MQVQNTNKIQNKHGIKLICAHVSKCVLVSFDHVGCWFNITWQVAFLPFMSLETIELATNSCQLILKHVIMTMCWQLFLMQAGWTCPPLVCFSCLAWHASNFLSITFLCYVSHSGLQVTILQMGGRKGGEGGGFIISYVTSNLLQNVYYLALGLTSPTKPLAFYTSQERH
jgi:hypothetical protein